MAVTIVMLGLTSGAEFDLTAYLTSRYFGRRNFGALYGGQYAIFGVGAGFSPALFGFVHDKAGSYNPILMVSATMFVLGGAVLLLLGRYPKLPTMR
jgi:cyanate permease